MHQSILDNFVASAIEVFQTMTGRTLVAQTPYTVNSVTCDEDMSAIVGLSGKLPGTVIVGVDRTLAFDFTEQVIGHITDTIDEQVIDAVGEIANMVVGGAKCRLTEYKLSISIPSVICGRGLTVNFPRSVRPVCIPFEGDGGRLTLCIGLYDAEGTASRCEIPEAEAKPSHGPILAAKEH